MHIITFANQKGGPGKTTLTMLTADELHRRGLKVLVIDTDSQASSHKWEVRTVANYAPVGFKVEHLSGLDQQKFGQALAKRVNDSNYVLIDTPPRLDSPELFAALYVADLAVIPFVPDGAHTEALEEVVPLFAKVNDARTRDGSGPLAVRILVNRHDSRRAGERTVAANAAEVTGFQCFRTMLGNWSAMQNAWNYHTSLSTITRPNDPARVAIAAVADEILGVLNGH